MKRFLSILLAVSILMMPLSLPVYAEDEDSGGFLSSAKGLWGSAVSGATEAATNAFNSAANTLGDTTDGLGDKLNDLLENANGAFSNASEWTKAFIAEQGSTLSATAGTSYENLQSWLAESGDTSLDVLHIAFINVAESMGIVGDSAAKLWDTVMYYAEINNITPVSMAKLALAVMTMVILSYAKQTDSIAGEYAQDYIEETLTTWFENFEITDQASADRALAEISVSVDSYMDENTWVCKACGEENHGNFCSGCGGQRPKKADTWECEECGEKNTGRFCSNCGLARPVEEDSWVCKECGEKNTGNYCVKCGASCPDVEDTWICEECGIESLGKFCSNCGTPRAED